MKTDEDVWLDAELGYELLQAIRELYWFYEHHESVERCKGLRLE